MHIPKPDQGGSFSPPPAGTHPAICYRIIDLGSQMSEYQGVRKVQRKILMSWELPNELMPTGEHAGEHFSIHSRLTLSMSEKATLRHYLESWRGKAFTEEDFEGPKRFDLRNVLGKACLLSIVHTTKGEKVYANISSISGMPRGMPAPDPVNQQVYFSMGEGRFDPLVLESLSDKLKETIKATPEYRELVEGAPPRSYEAGDDFHDPSEPPF
jgi:hypothetical protein